MKEKSLFTKIIIGEIPCHKIYEDEKVIAFLEIHPVKPGHTLVVPKVQIDHIWDLNDQDYQYLWKITKIIGNHIKDTMGSKRLGVIVEGFGVPHAHIHLIPIDKENDIRYLPDHNADVKHEELTKIAKKLRIN